ncbi:hypothetical protein SAMN06297422_12210 [Lachnospiraceae bacterium]|nr:hypothetical protein SAMN06297422_12210 [Lachnospiraceae bacterium]
MLNLYSRITSTKRMAMQTKKAHGPVFVVQEYVKDKQ